MSKERSPIIQAAELLSIYQTDNLVLVDASGGKNAKENYVKKHLDSALFVDVNTQLADIKADLSKGGRHPLPTTKQFSETLATLGISKKSHVVIYDDVNGANAATRFWWMLKAIGHNNVQVLNGGFNEAERMGFPVNSKIETPRIVDPYEIDLWQLPLADINEVESVSHDKGHLVIDVRDRKRFNGETEPIDLIAGHIPGAINVPYSSNLDDQGLFLLPSDLRSKYQKIVDKLPAEKIIVHCGSGVTACHTLLAFAIAELEIPKLYVGSWSEWSRNDKVIETSIGA